MSATYKRGDALRTNFPGKPHREQVFKLLHPVSRLGDSSGGQWWVRVCFDRSLITVFVNSCLRVSPAWMKRFRLS